MISDLQLYPSYKDSGVEWLGDVPEQWGIKRLKSHLILNDSGIWGEEFIDNGTIVLRSTEQTIYGGWDIKDPAIISLSKSQIAASKLKIGDLVLTKSSGSSNHIGKTSLVDEGIAELNCCFSNFMQRLRLDLFTNPKFIWRCFNSIVGREQLIYQSTTTTGLGNLNGTIIENCVFAFPPLSEQNAIVRYLDYMDRRIRRYINAKKKLIALLEEEKKAIIHNAVTRGLDPNVRLKPSGVEWLGDVPEHWGILILGRCLKSIEQGWSPVGAEGDLQPDQWAVITLSSIHKGKFNSSAFKPIPYSVTIPEGIEIREGDLLISRSNTRDLVGDVCIVTNPRERTIICDLIYRLNPNLKIFDREYLMFLLLSSFGRILIERDARGSSGTMPKINQTHIRSWKVIVPPLDEQKTILEHINYNIKILSTISEHTHRQIALLQEYRTRLIADVVTGKLDVREAAAHLPEEADENDLEIDESLDDLCGINEIEEVDRADGVDNDEVERE